MNLALVAPPRIEFIEEGHRYLVNGEEKRSWSSIAKAAGLLAELDAVPVHILENAKARGSQIHDACALIMESQPLDMERVHPEARPYVQAYWEWWLGFGQSTGHVETPLYCRKLDFCCTPDWHDEKSVNDIKSTSQVSRTWGLQTAAQYLAHGEATVRRIIWLRPKLKRQQVEVHVAHEENRRIFSALDLQVVEAACQGDFDADVIRRWREGE